MKSDSPLAQVLARLEGVEEYNGGFRARCPAHDDHDPSLQIREVEENGSRRVLLHCFVCKDQEKVLQALEKRGIAKADLFNNPSKTPNKGGAKKPKRRMCLTKAYDYRTPNGKFIRHCTLRFTPPPEGAEHHPDCRGQHIDSSRKDKDFRQARPNETGSYAYDLNGVQPILYNLTDVMQAALQGETVVWVEGEKDADNGTERLGLTMTTCPLGAKSWKAHYAGYLTGARVVVVADNDGPGLEHAETVAKELEPIAASVKILRLPGIPDGGDLSDWIDLGGTREAFDELVKNAPEFHFGHLRKVGGRNESFPVKTVSEVLAESGAGAAWKVESLLAKGNVTDLSGEAKSSGKTTLAMHMVACILEGKDFMGFETEESKVLYLSEQGNNFAEALQKAGLMGADGKLYVVQHRDVRTIDWKELVSKAVEACLRLGADVLLIDTFAAFSGIVGTEENNSGDIRQKLEPVKAAAQEHDLAVLYIRHAGKSGKARGSSQFEAEGDIILTVKRPDGNPKDTVRVLEGIGRFDTIPRKLNIELTGDGYVALGSDERVEFGKAIKALKRHVPQALENAKTQDELLEALEDEEVSRKTMQRALDWLIDVGAIRKEGKGVRGQPWRYWMPPEDATPTQGSEEEIDSGQAPSLNDRKVNTREGDGGEWTPSSSETSRISETEPSIWDCLITDSERLLSEVVPALKRCDNVALDLETTNLSPFEGKVRLLSLHAGDMTFLIDCSALDPSPILKVMKDKVLYVHNAEFDLPYLYHAYGFEPLKTPIDTLHLSQVVRAGEWVPKEGGSWVRKKHSLEDVLKRELGVRFGDKKKYQRGKAWTEDLGVEHLRYARNDVVHLHALAESLFALLEERNLAEIWKLELRAKPLFLMMCMRGLPFDKARWDKLTEPLGTKALELKEYADALAPPRPEGGTWNWRSTKQAKQAFKLAGLDVPNLQRETLAGYEDSLVKAVSAYRDADNELSQHRKWYEGRYQDGRVHPHWHPGGAETGRVSCSQPNVQSLTSVGGYRDCVRPKEGRVLIVADLNQAELRVLAAITEDQNMIDIFKRGGDVNVHTAEAITGRKIRKSDPERERAKAVNFGLSFGMGAKSFLEKARKDYGVEMTEDEAKMAKRKLLDTYPGIGDWHRRESAEVKKRNFVTHTLFGRRRVVEPDRKGRPKCP